MARIMDKTSEFYDHDAVHKGQKSSTERMSLVDDDIILIKDDSSPGLFLAKRKGVLKTVSFTAAEAFLIKGMQEPHNEIVLLAKCNARFPGELVASDLRKLIEKLKNAGLIVDKKSEEYTSKAGMENHQTHPGQGMEEENERAVFKNHLSFFKPQSFLDCMLKSLGFLRHFKILVPIVLVFSIVGVVSNKDLFFSDIINIRSHITIFNRLVFTLFTLSLMTQLYRGIIARHFGFKTPSFGMILVFGLLPRFNIRVTVPEDSMRTARLWFFAAPIYLRFIVFPMGVMIWLITRDQGTYLPLIGASLSAVSVISFLFVANPLLGGAGYRFLSEYFETPNLRKKAFARLKSLFSKQPPVVMQYVDRSASVLVYGVLSILFSLILIGFIAYLVASRLEKNFQGTGVAISLILIVYLFFRFGYQYLLNQRRRRKAKLAVDAPQTKVSASGPKKKSGFARNFRVRIPYVFFLILLGACFIPYQYESGGEVEVFPAASVKIFSESPQLVKKVYYDGGEILKKGVVIAVLMDDRQKFDVEKTEKEIVKKEEELNVLLSTPSQEKIRVAQEELKKAEVQLRYSEQLHKVLEGLYKKNSITLLEYKDALRQRELDQQTVQLAKANLNYIKNQVNQHEIEVIKIEISILQDQLVYYQQMLDRTQLKMPIDGKLASMNLKSLTNSYINAGELFAQVEDVSEVRVEIKIPESDIGEVFPGSAVEIKLRSYPNRSFNGKIRNVYPMAIVESSGRYVVSDCIIINKNGDIKSGMTGFAKIKGREMIAIKAFSRAIVRFFKIELWSWIP